MKDIAFVSRRGLLTSAKCWGAALLASSVLASGLEAAQTGREKRKPAEVSPPEDLMREHGVLGRILLVYEEILRRGDENPALCQQVLDGCAGLIRRFVEDYHEKLEEEHLFPRFVTAGKLTDLVRTLREQHQAGRTLTDLIREAASRSDFKDRNNREEAGRKMLLFIRMYRPHKAREDTVLFPAFHSLLSAEEFDRLGDRFETRERALWGENGFGRIVAEVAEFEKKLNIHELSRFTSNP